MRNSRNQARRRQRRTARYLDRTAGFTLDLTPEEILAELEPTWFAEVDQIEERAHEDEAAA